MQIRAPKEAELQRAAGRTPRDTDHVTVHVWEVQAGTVVGPSPALSASLARACAY